MRNENIFTIQKNKTTRMLFASTFVLSSLTFNFQAHAGQYEFTPDIYDQEKALKRIRECTSPLTEEQIDQILETELFNRKLEHIKKCKLPLFEKQIEWLEERFKGALSAHEKRELFEKISGIFDSAPIIGSFVSTALQVGPAPGMLVGVGIQTAAKVASHFAKVKFTPSTPDSYAQPSNVQAEKQKLELEVIKLVEGLKYEPEGYLNTLEREYIRKKRKIQDPQLKRQIELDLLEARTSIQFGISATELIQNALLLPVSHKVITESLRDINKRYDRDPRFAIYEPELRGLLKNVILEVALDSRVPDDAGVSLRRIYVFEGVASSGKSTAAREIPQFFDLPYVEINISSIKELNEVAVDGSRAHFNITTGWFIKPFLERSKKDGKTYSNAFLIINDSDRVLSPNNSQSEAFCKNYFDPDKIDFSNKYFNVLFPIRRLTIIIKTNKSKQETPKDLPLFSRVTYISFPKFQEFALKQSMDAKLKPLREWGELPEFMTLSYENPKEIKVAYDEKKLKAYGIVEIRSPETVPVLLPQGADSESITSRDLEHKHLKTTVLNLNLNNERKAEELIKLGKDEYSRKQHDKGRKYLVEAAIKGHSKALRLLEEIQKEPKYETIYSCKKFVKKEKEKSKETVNREELMSSSHFVGNYYFEKGDLETAKKWYKNAHTFGDFDIEEKISWIENMGDELYHEKSPLWSDLLFLETYPKKSIYSQRIGEIYLKVAKYKTQLNPPQFDAAYYDFVLAQEFGNEEATSELFHLGERLESIYGLGNEKAVKCFKCAASKSSIEAAFKVGWLSLLNKEYEEAYKYAMLSNHFAQDEYFWSLWLIGNLFKEGHGVPKDTSIALYYYDKAKLLVKDDVYSKAFLIQEILSLEEQGSIELRGPISRDYHILSVLKVAAPFIKDVVATPSRFGLPTSHSSFIVDQVRYPWGFYGINIAFLMLAKEACLSNYTSFSYPITWSRKKTKLRYASLIDEKINALRQQPQPLAHYQQVSSQALVRVNRTHFAETKPTSHGPFKAKNLLANYGETKQDVTMRNSYEVGEIVGDGDCFFHAVFTEYGLTLDMMKQFAGQLRQKLPEIVMQSTRFKDMMKREWIASEKLLKKDNNFNPNLDEITDDTLRAYLMLYERNTNHSSCYIQIPAGRNELSSLGNVIAEYKRVRINCFTYREDTDELLYKDAIGVIDDPERVVNILIHGNHFYALLNDEESEERKRGVQQAMLNARASRGEEEKTLDVNMEPFQGNQGFGRLNIQVIEDGVGDEADDETQRLLPDMGGVEMTTPYKMKLKVNYKTMPMYKIIYNMFFKQLGYKKSL